MYFYPFYARFYHRIAYTVYFHCLYVRLLRVTLSRSINQSIVSAFYSAMHVCINRSAIYVVR